MMRLISKIFFKLAGWQIEGSIPAEINRCVMIAAPHTSNYDFLFARAGCYLLNIKVRYLIKRSWMIFPLSLFFRATGAIAVERKQSNCQVNNLIHTIQQAEKIVVMVAPEGTRKSVTKWKTGFYYAAVGAEVPIVLSYVDYKKKRAGIGPVIYPTGDLARDMQVIQSYYQQISPKHPHAYNVAPKVD